MAGGVHLQHLRLFSRGRGKSQTACQIPKHFGSSGGSWPGPPSIGHPAGKTPLVASRSLLDQAGLADAWRTGEQYHHRRMA